MAFHEVLYTHTCNNPKRGPLRSNARATVVLTDGSPAYTRLRTLLIQYDSVDHELSNLTDNTKREHVCSWCDAPMTRVGTVREIAQQGPSDKTAKFLDDDWFELNGVNLLP